MIDVLSAAIAQKVVPLVTRGIERSQLDREITPGGAPGLQAGTLAGARPVDKAPTLERVLEDLHVAIRGAHESIEILRAKLDPLFAPENPNGCNEGPGAVSGEVPSFSPAVCNVKNATEGVLLLVRRVFALTERLQLEGAR